MRDIDESGKRLLDLSLAGSQSQNSQPPETPEPDSNGVPIVSNNVDNGNRQSPQQVSGFKLSETQKRILETCGFERQALDAMTFPSHVEAYEWCGKQMHSPRKRKSPPPADQRLTGQRTPPKSIRLTRPQIDVLVQCGHNRRDLENMRFSTPQESYHWVGVNVGESYCGDYYCSPHPVYDVYNEEYNYYDDDDELILEDGLYDEEYNYYDDDSSDDEPSVDEPNDALHRLDQDDIEFLRNGSFSSSFSSLDQDAPGSAPVESTPRNGSTEPIVDLTKDGDAPTAHHATDPLCGICFEPMGSNTDRHMAAGNCGHVYCKDCLVHAVMVRKRCPSCNKRMNIRDIRNIYLDS